MTGVSRGMLVAGLAAVAVGSGLIGLSAGLGHEPLTALRTALAIHRETYTLPRSYALWLPYNLVDLAFFVGPPVALLFACRTTDSRFGRASAAGRGLLLLSGATRGEVGRIWIPLMPFVLVGALARPATEGEEASPSRGTALLLGTLLAALDIVLRLRWQL